MGNVLPAPQRPYGSISNPFAEVLMENDLDNRARDLNERAHVLESSQRPYTGATTATLPTPEAYDRYWTNEYQSIARESNDLLSSYHNALGDRRHTDPVSLACETRPLPAVEGVTQGYVVQTPEIREACLRQSFSVWQSQRRKLMIAGFVSTAVVVAVVSGVILHRRRKQAARKKTETLST